MVVELISVGTEILLGNIVNTNAAFLSEKCAALGLSCYHQSVVGDNEGRLEETIRLALSRSDIVILSGGLGPTKDDLTKEVTAKVFGKALCEDAHTKERIAGYFVNMKSKNITENNWKQAMVPEGARIVDNHNGTAPGLIIEEDGKTAILLPGPPNEIRPMFEQDIMPYLRNLEPEGIYSKMVKICAIGESRAETMVSELLEGQSNPTIAPYAKTGEVHFRITAKAADEKEADRLIEPVIRYMYRVFGDKIFATSEEVALEDAVVELLEEKGLTLTTAESCTAGLLAGRIMNVAGASKVYNEGYITYSNEAKERILGVKHETLEKYGAVSARTAAEMAEGAAKAAKASASVSVTGIAGPGGGTEEKPVGLVYVGCQVNGKTRTEELRFTGNRAKNREYAVVRALTILWEELMVS
ncbi:MAG: competence/damage-inducible protein A [Dorea sp.]|nr:competence/damage-inducible protein A [Dorea sp.]